MKRLILIIGILMALSVFSNSDYTNYGKYGGQRISTTTYTIDKRNNGNFEISNPTSNVVIILSTTGAVTANTYYGDGSNLTGISVAGDNLGNHIATTTLHMDNFAIQSSSAINANEFKLLGTTYLHNPGSNNLFIAPVPNWSSGVRNLVAGVSAGASLSSGDNNTFIGYLTGQNVSSGDNNTVVGTQAGQSLNSSVHNSSLFGYQAGANLTTSSLYCSAFGSGALSSMSAGNGNSVFGQAAGATINSASFNTIIGYEAALNKTGGANNTILGTRAGHESSSGADNVFIGYRAAYNETGNNKLYIENSDSASPLIYGEFDNDLIRINGDHYITGFSSATAYYGDGSNLTGIDVGAGSPDIVFTYLGDIFDSTATYVNGLSNTILKQSISVANYDIFIGSATSDSFGIEISTKPLTSIAWSVVETLTVPAAISTHTATSTTFSLSENDLIKFGFTSTDSSDPAGDITIKVND